jgi:hypothetical protein
MCLSTKVFLVGNALPRVADSLNYMIGLIDELYD